MTDFVFDMETGDPDDVLTLALMAGHPAINLVGVTITPGTPHQIGVVRHVLFERLGHPEIPIGAFNLDHMKARGTPEERYVTCVSAWHNRTFGDIDPSRDAAPGWQVLEGFREQAQIVTGGPLKNLGQCLRQLESAGADEVAQGPLFRPLTLQGGFAGDNIVPPERRLEKFEGRLTCPTYNLNGDPKSALLTFERAAWFDSVRMVSKNVCHGVIYDQAMHEALRPHRSAHAGLELVVWAMERYLARNSRGKAFHDPLAAMCALDPSIGTWARVEPYREKGQWGARAQPGSSIEIITGYDRQRFLDGMVGLPTAQRGSGV